MKPSFTERVAPFLTAVLIVGLTACGQTEPVPSGLGCPEGAAPVGRVGEGTWCEKDRGVKHGPYRLWKPNGTLAQEGFYRDGLQEGPWKTYWDNGRLHEEGMYRKGERVGLWREYRREGALEAELGHDVSGKPHGLWRELNPDGSLYRASCFRHGVALWRAFMPRGPTPACPVDGDDTARGSARPAKP